MLGTTADWGGYTQAVDQILGLVEEETVLQLARDLLEAFKEDRQVFVIGNGGMASVASHVAEDFTSQLVDRKGGVGTECRFRVHDLTACSPWLTAIGNDYGFDQIFAEQLRHYAQDGDVLLALSCSGNSRNIARAVQFANTQNMVVWGFTGQQCSEVRARATHTLRFQTTDTGIIQDLSMTVLHWVLGWMYSEIHGVKDDRHAETLTDADCDAGGDCGDPSEGRAGHEADTRAGEAAQEAPRGSTGDPAGDQQVAQQERPPCCDHL